MNHKTVSLTLLLAALVSLIGSHLFTFSYLLPQASRMIWSAHDVFQRNAKEKISQQEYDRAYVFWLRDSTTVIAWARSLDGIFQVLSSVLFILAFAAAYRRPALMSASMASGDRGSA